MPKTKSGKDFDSSHFNEPNILAHVRFNTRIGPNGEKILFIEEIQSDWHSEGRKHGYATGKSTKPKASILESNTGESFSLYDSNSDLFGRFSTREEAAERAVSLGFDPVNEVVPSQLRAMNNLVPDAPFKSSWHELATKRMLRYAAENGYDKLAFIDGSETANRYDLSKKIDGLELIDNQDGTYEIMVKQVGDDAYRTLENNIKKDEVSNYIGKEVAKTAFNKMDDGLASLEGLDLKIGGDWAFNLYDRMIPQFLKKYGKKFGAKVEDVGVDIRHTAKYRTTKDFSSGSFKAIDITPQMRSEDGVMGGQVRFMPGVEKFDTVEPSIISESVKVKPGSLDGVRFMPGTAPRIPLSQVADSDPFIMLSDRMADMVYEVPGSGVRIPIHGGPGFSYRDGKAVWASTRNAAKKIGNYVNNSGKNRALIMIQRDDNHSKNPSMGRIFVEELKAREKNITKTDMNKMLRAASKRAGLKKSVKNLNELESLYTFWDWDTRGNFFGQFGLVNKPHSPIGDPRKRGFFDYHQIIKDTTDPALADLPTGSIVGAIEFDGGKVYEASELGTVPHSSYDTMLKGRGLGLFENPPHISDILDVPENQRSVFTLSRRFTSPNRLKEAAKLEVDKIIKIPAKKKVQRKDRAMEILKQFSKNKNANRNTKKTQ